MIDFVHIGCHKTASTWFQKAWFKQQTGVVSLKQILAERYGTFLNSFFSTENGEAEAVATLRQMLNEIPRKRILGQGQSIVGWSHENISGHIYTGVGLRSNARKLLKMAGKKKVLICIRNQRPMIHSIYAQYIKLGGTRTFNDFLNGKTAPGQHLVDKLKYHRMINVYKELFDDRMVHVFLFEDFLHATQECLAGIANHIGVPSSIWHTSEKLNSSLSPFGLQACRAINSLARKYPAVSDKRHILYNRIHIVDSKSKAITTKYSSWENNSEAKAFKEKFRSSNEKLLPLFGKKLKIYGYL